MKIEIPDPTDSIRFEELCCMCEDGRTDCYNCDNKGFIEKKVRGRMTHPTCPTCRGSRKCGRCDGTGYVTTWAGERLLDFLKRHGVISE